MGQSHRRRSGGVQAAIMWRHSGGDQVAIRQAALLAAIRRQSGGDKVTIQAAFRRQLASDQVTSGGNQTAIGQHS